MLRNNSKHAFKSILITIRDRLKQSLHQDNIENIYKVYIQTSKKMIYLLKLSPIFSTCIEFQQLLVQCVQIITIFIEASEFQKYGHIFPAFKVLTSRLQKIVKCKVSQPNQQRILERIQKNQKFHKQNKLTQFQPNEINFLESNQIGKYIQYCANNEVILHNSQCVCCSQVFIKDFKILNKNPFIHLFIQLTKQQCMDKAQLLKNLCAMCNEGGGVIIVGARKKGNNLVATGVKFKSEEQISQMQQQVRKFCSQIKPSCKYKIQRVRLHGNFTDQPNIYEQHLRICLRIFIFPNEWPKICYFQFQNKGYHNLYEIYRFNSQLRPVKINSIEQNGQVNGIYNKIHEKYYQIQGQNSHKNIYCFHPHPDYSQIYKIYKAQNKIKAQSQQEKQTISKEQKIDKQKYKDQLKFKYKFSSLIIIGSNKSKRLIQNLIEFFDNLKQLYQLEKCFPNYFDGTARTVWMLSHNKNYSELKNLINLFSQKDSIKPGSIIVMPVCKTLQIQKAKFSQQNQTYIQKKFNLRYGQPIQTEIVQINDSKNGEKKKMVELTFSNYSQAIFAYMIFEQRQLRPYFIKVGNHHKWKTNN